jgi:hypothetical protein
MSHKLQTKQSKKQLIQASFYECFAVLEYVAVEAGYLLKDLLFFHYASTNVDVEKSTKQYRFQRVVGSMNAQDTR